MSRKKPILAESLKVAIGIVGFATAFFLLGYFIATGSMRETQEWVTPDGRKVIYRNGCITMKGDGNAGDATVCGGQRGRR